LAIAVEPCIPARRPQTIIGWYAAGRRWNDATVARDMPWRRLRPRCTAGNCARPAPRRSQSRCRRSVRLWLELLFYFQTRAIFYSLFGLFLLLLLRALLKKTLIASAVWVTALAVLLAQAEQQPLDYVLGAAMGLILLLVVNRYGLLTFAVAFFWYLFLTTLPLTTDVHRWYAGTTIAVTILFAASLLTSLRTALTA
jgi:hypothetical protein